MKIKTNKLIGGSLDWAVATIESQRNDVSNSDKFYWKEVFSHWEEYSECLTYSTDWSKGGPIIGRERISSTDQHGCKGMELWMASLVLPDDNGTIIEWGPTHLDATMRCYVSSILGNIVEVPEALV